VHCRPPGHMDHTVLRRAHQPTRLDSFQAVYYRLIIKCCFYNL
jgi:hypothetical protein